MSTSRALGLAWAISLCLVPALARAATIQIDFSGTVTTFEDDGALDGSIGVGTPFSGSVTFDPSASDTNAALDVGTYDFPVPPNALSFTAGSYTVTSLLSFGVDTVVDAGGLDPGDHVIFQTSSDVSLSGTLSAELDGLAFNFRYGDPDGGTLTSDALGDVPFGLAGWPSVEIVFIVDVFDSETNESATAVVSGPVTSLSVVPEPSAWALLAIGSGLLGVRGSRQRRP